MTEVTAAVLRRGDRVLIARRPPGSRQAGKWEFPGGKIEAGESAPDCLRRELREELGLDVEIGRFLGDVAHAYEWGEIRLLFFEARDTGGEPALRAHDRVAWVTPAEMGDYDFAPADLPMVRRLASVCEPPGSSSMLEVETQLPDSACSAAPGGGIVLDKPDIARRGAGSYT